MTNEKEFRLDEAFFLQIKIYDKWEFVDKKLETFCKTYAPRSIDVLAMSKSYQSEVELYLDVIYQKEKPTIKHNNKHKSFRFYAIKGDSFSDSFSYVDAILFLIEKQGFLSLNITNKNPVKLLDNKNPHSVSLSTKQEKENNVVHKRMFRKILEISNPYDNFKFIGENASSHYLDIEKLFTNVYKNTLEIIFSVYPN